MAPSAPVPIAMPTSVRLRERVPYAITARLLTTSFNRIVILWVLIGAITGIVGMYVSYYVDIASGATIVLVPATFFSISLL